MSILAFISLLLFNSGHVCISAQDSASQDPEPATRAEFDETIAQWKEVCKKMRKLTQYDFILASEKELPEIVEKREKLVAEGQRLYGVAIHQAAEIYPRQPSEDLRNFLRAVRTKLLDIGFLDTALKVGLALQEGGTGELPETDVANMITLFQIANFCSEYEAAADLLERIKDITNQYPPGTQKFLEMQPKLSADWKAENELRKKEEEEAENPIVQFKTTKGSVEVELFENQAPNSVAHFLDLVQQGFYDGLRFYDVRQNGLAFSGSPNSDGGNDPNFVIDAENKSADARPHHRGTLTLMSLQNETQSGSIFAFCRVSNPGLNGRVTAIGRVTEGMSVIDQLSNSVKLNDEGEMEQVEKFEPDSIISATVVRPSNRNIEPVRVAPRPARNSSKQN